MINLNKYNNNKKRMNKKRRLKENDQVKLKKKFLMNYLINTNTLVKWMMIKWLNKLIRLINN